MRQVSSWKAFAVVFLRIRSKFELNSSVTRRCQLVVVLCWIATTVQTREKEFLYIILLPAAVFYQVGKDSCPHSTRTSTQPAVLLFALSISLMTVLPGLIMWEDPWNALYSGAIPSVWKKKLKTKYFLVIVALLHKLTTLSFARRKHDILVRTYSVFRHTYNLHVLISFTWDQLISACASIYLVSVLIKR